MSAPELLLAFLACLGVGVVSAIMGLGGGLFLVPLLTLIPSVSLDAARGTSLICTLATSAAGSVALDKARLAKFDLVLGFECAAGLGALVGVWFLRPHLPKHVVYGSFALLVIVAALRMARSALKAPSKLIDPSSPAEESSAEETSKAPEAAPETEYPVNLGWGALGFVFSGIASGVLGIGGSPIKVPVQTEVCRVPLRVALANSNLMVGITAGVGAALYFGEGQIALALVAPCALGISLGAYLGGLLAPKLPVDRLRWAFTLILAVVAARMLWATFK
jgi:uncharacterized protein